MGENIGKRGFGIKEDGTIVRNRKCPKCGRESYSEGEFCEHCGANIEKKSNRGAVVAVFIALLIIGGVAAFFVTQYFNQDTTVAESNIDMERVKNAISTHNKAYATNDYATLSETYSNHVTRYHNAYGLSNSEVVDKYRNYDSKFGVRSKHATVRWNTLQVERISDNELSVIYVEDYNIDRVDKSQKSRYVLEQHLVLDNDYKIKSIYDVQLQ